MTDSIQSARNHIELLDLRPHLDRAVQEGRFSIAEQPAATLEYRQFLLLVWLNTYQGRDTPIAMTELAEDVWQCHRRTSDGTEFFIQLRNREITLLDVMPAIWIGSNSADAREVREHTCSLTAQISPEHSFCPGYLRQLEPAAAAEV